MNLKRWEDVERLVLNAIPETSGLEYKRELSLGSRGERIETLKDLSGMGNGGGGTILYGVDERDDSVAAALTPLTDSADVGRLEDLVRDTIRPPLLWQFDVVQGDGGHVLAVEVQRSPLGPYMVEAYDQRRYFVRIGRSTVPMSEQQVRDAYLLAARGREQRAATWEAHDLPMEPTWVNPWLVTSALPEEPLTDLFDPAVLAPDELRPPGSMRRQMEPADLDDLMSRTRIWADGIFAEERYQNDKHPYSVARIHRDGAVGIALSLRESMFSTTILRPLHAQLLYLGWLWERLEVRTPVEIDVRLLNPAGLKMTFGHFREDRELNVPDGVEIRDIVVRREVLPGDLRRAGVRHEIVREMANRVHQAYGFPRAEIALTTGWLYGREGQVLGFGYHGRCLWNEKGQMAASVFENGRVDHLNKAFLVGFFRDGVLLDPEGRTIGLLEFGSGPGVPDDFVHQQFPDDPRARTSGNSGDPLPDPRDEPAPDPIGEWSQVDLAERLRPEADP